jgi:hypothetical protein
VLNTCSTVRCRNREACGAPSRRACTTSNTSSCSQRLMRRYGAGVHCHENLDDHRVLQCGRSRHASCESFSSRRLALTTRSLLKRQRLQPLNCRRSSSPLHRQQRAPSVGGLCVPRWYCSFNPGSTVPRLLLDSQSAHGRTERVSDPA